MEKFRDWMTLKKIIWMIIGLGVIFRLAQYLHNRAFWLDELTVAFQIQKPFWEMLTTMGTSSKGPPAFYSAVKFLVHILGDNELVFRLFPLVAGILSLFLFYTVGKRILSQRGLIIALGLFVLSDPLIRSSSELKWYSSDVTIALAIFLLAQHWLDRDSEFVRSTIFISLIGSILIWFSYPSVFCLASLGLTMAVYLIKEKNGAQMAWLLVPALFWLSSFAVFFYGFLRELSVSGTLITYYANGFMPLPPLSLQDLMWFPRRFFGVFPESAGIPFAGLAAFCFVIGCISLIHRNRYHFSILTLPILFALVASGLQKYPLVDRLLLFIVPTIMIIIGEGVDTIVHKTRHTGRFVPIILCVLLFLQPTYIAAKRLWKPWEYEEVKPVLNYLKQNYQNGDGLYLYYMSKKAFRFYAKRFGLEEINPLVGEYNKSRNNWSNYVNELKNELNGLPRKKRMWILFSHVHRYSGVKEEKFFLYVLDEMGEQVDSFNQVGASVYLYDLHESLDGTLRVE